MNRTHHRCPPILLVPICTKCELDAADEIQRNQEWRSRLFAAHGHDINNPEDPWNEL